MTTGPAAVYVVGETIGAFPSQTNQGGRDGFVSKFDVLGNEQWTRQFGTSVLDSPRGVAADATGVYVAGFTNGTLGQSSAGSTDAFVRKYDVNGSEQWTRQFGTSDVDQALAIASDGTSIYVVGSVRGALPGQTLSGGDDAFVRKYDSNGVEQWTRQFVVLASSFGPDGKLVTTLGGTSVTINNVPAPLFYSLPGQLAVQVPFETAGQTLATIRVTVGGQTSVPRTFAVDAFAPGFLTLTSDGRGTAVVLHQDGITLVTAQNPARPDEVVVFFGTGLGVLTPPLATGEPSVGNRTATPSILIGGAQAELLFSGAAPGFVGLNQINLRIPAATVPGSAVPVLLTIGGKQSNAVTIPVAP